MYDKLQECLEIAEEICDDMTGEYPIGRERIRRLLRDVLAEFAACEPKPIEPPDDAGDYCYLGATPDATEPGK